MRLAVWLMIRFGVPEPLVGDLVETYRRGSAFWLARQAVAAIALTAIRDVRRQPFAAVRSILAGWTVLLLLFVLLGDRVADALAYLGWGWTRAAGYDGGDWWPYRVTAAFTSYTGFALAAWAVARQHRAHAGAALLAYIVSVLVALTASAALVEWSGPIRVPHPFFYVMSVALRYQGRSGFLLVPAVSVVFGVLGASAGTTTRQHAGG